MDDLKFKRVKDTQEFRSGRCGICGLKEECGCKLKTKTKKKRNQPIVISGDKARELATIISRANEIYGKTD